MLFGDLSGRDFDKNYGEFFFRNEDLKKMQSDNPIFFQISDYYETKDTYVFEFIINTHDIKSLTINEIGLFDKNMQLCFYSVGDAIWYPTEFSFRHQFVINKEDIRSIENLS